MAGLSVLGNTVFTCITVVLLTACVLQWWWWWTSDRGYGQFDIWSIYHIGI